METRRSPQVQNGFLGPTAALESLSEKASLEASPAKAIALGARVHRQTRGPTQMGNGIQCAGAAPSD